ncbi:MAG: hypothetical protein WCL39_09625, partial [Armatimonadota bacterium]
MKLDDFAKPDNILRPAPFWSINDRITAEETARQMEDMISAGLSGGFFHSRAGLITDYMGDEWFESMEAALEIARRDDGYLWLYDEDQWPSGNAGGQVAGLKSEYRAALLEAILVPARERPPVLNDDQELRFCYAIRSRNGILLEDFQRLDSASSKTVVDCERLFLVREYAPKTGRWGGESYSNLLDPDAVQQFIRFTHKAYDERLGSEFGKRIPGMFTDEPQLSYSQTGIAWCDDLPAHYTQWTGRDIAMDLPLVFFDGTDARKVRLLVHRTILRQFLEAFSRPLFQWCDAHNLAHTGHFNAEENFLSQIIYHSGGVMAHYRYQHIPGIDHLCRQIHGRRPGDKGMLLTCKQVSSAARQMGRKRVLSELFGVTRHSNTFEDFRWLADYNIVLGVNFLCPHLTWYSARGRRKRDFPPTWNYQQTYWSDLRLLNDYFARVCYVLTQGRPDVPVLVLHSIEAATAEHRKGVQLKSCTNGASTNDQGESFGSADEMDDDLRRTVAAIAQTGYDCDLGDESFLEDYGRVDGDSFVIGEMAYKIVVMPPAVTWRPGTYELVKLFAANGGKVIILGRLPKELDCSPAQSEWANLMSLPSVSSLPCASHAVRAAVDSVDCTTYILRDTDGRTVPDTYVQHRVDGDQDIFFIVNSDRDNRREYVLVLHGASSKPLLRWNALEGNCTRENASQIGADLRYQFALPACDSVILTVGGVADALVKPAEADLSNGVMTPVPDLFDFERSDDNVLVIDWISISYDGGRTFETECPDYQIRKQIAERFGTSPALEWQPWVAVRKRLFDDKGGEIVLRYLFESKIDHPKCYAVLEDLRKGHLQVNGESVDTSNAAWQWDKGFGKVAITDLVKQGSNTLDFRVNFDFLTEVEPAYVVGSFGVELADARTGRITAEPDKLAKGSWVTQGYPFYSGRMLYS